MLVLLPWYGSNTLVVQICGKRALAISRVRLRTDYRTPENPDQKGPPELANTLQLPRSLLLPTVFNELSLHDPVVLFTLSSFPVSKQQVLFFAADMRL